MSSATTTRPAAEPATGVRGEILGVLAALPDRPAEDRATRGGSAGDRAVGLSAPELGERLGLHVSTVRFHLDQLVATGAVVPGAPSSAERGRRGRPRKRYAVNASPRPGARDDQAFRLLAELLTESCAVPGEAARAATPEEAGRRWARHHARSVLGAPGRTSSTRATSTGQWLGKVGQVVDLLHHWGYEPDVALGEQGRTAEISLSHCPFYDMAKAREAVVCGVHRGLIRGTLEALGENQTQVVLDPFVEEHLCRATVRTEARFGEEGAR